MIRIAFVQGRGCPQVVCDGCRGVITDARDGTALWTMSLGACRRGGAGVVYHVHKGCFDAFEADHPGEWGTDELGVHLAYLGGNLGLDVRLPVPFAISLRGRK